VTQMRNNKWRGKSNKRRTAQREHPNHLPINEASFEQWRQGFMEDQTDEGELRGNIATAMIGG
jgi:hypothetical protein